MHVFPVAFYINANQLLIFINFQKKLQFHVGYKQGTRVNRLRAIALENNEKQTEIFAIQCAVSHGVWLRSARVRSTKH